MAREKEAKRGKSYYSDSARRQRTSIMLGNCIENKTHNKSKLDIATWCVAIKIDLHVYVIRGVIKISYRVDKPLPLR